MSCALGIKAFKKKNFEKCFPMQTTKHVYLSMSVKSQETWKHCIHNIIRALLQISTQKYCLRHIKHIQKLQNFHNIQMASPLTNFNFPHFPPPPPPPRPSIPPPPPHITPPRPPSPPDNGPTVIVIIFISFGCLFFLAFLVIALCCYIKKKKKKRVQETDVIHVDEHIRVREAIVPGPHGAQSVVLAFEDDVHVEEEIRKNEKVGKGTHLKSADNIPSALEEGASTSSSSHHHVEHKP